MHEAFLHPHNHDLVVPFSYVKTLRLREVKWLLQAHSERKKQIWMQTKGIPAPGLMLSSIFKAVALKQSRRHFLFSLLWRNLGDIFCFPKTLTIDLVMFVFSYSFRSCFVRYFRNRVRGSSGWKRCFSFRWQSLYIHCKWQYFSCWVCTEKLIRCCHSYK